MGLMIFLKGILKSKPTITKCDCCGAEGGQLLVCRTLVQKEVAGLDVASKIMVQE